MYADLNRRIENMIRFGLIAEVDYANAKAKVKCGQILTDFLPFVTLRTGTTKTWSPPTVDEQCILLAMSGELNTACILTGLYTQNSPSKNQDEHIIEFADGAVIKYDQKSGQLEVTGIKSAVINAADHIEITVPKVTINGDVQVNGSIKSTGDQVAGSISQIKHIHGGVMGGPGTTGKPQ